MLRCDEDAVLSRTTVCAHVHRAENVCLQGGPKKGATLVFLKQLSQKLADFSDFLYTESSRNVTSDDYKFNPPPHL